MRKKLAILMSAFYLPLQISPSYSDEDAKRDFDAITAIIRRQLGAGPGPADTSNIAELLKDVPIGLGKGTPPPGYGTGASLSPKTSSSSNNGTDSGVASPAVSRGPSPSPSPSPTIKSITSPSAYKDLQFASLEDLKATERELTKTIKGQLGADKDNPRETAGWLLRSVRKTNLVENSRAQAAAQKAAAQKAAADQKAQEQKLIQDASAEAPKPLIK